MRARGQLKRWVLLIAVLITGCDRTPSTDPGSNADVFSGPATAATAALHSLEKLAQCGDGFVPYPLDHVTIGHDPDIHKFESNGSGVAVGDLDDDGLLDIVLANVGGQATVLWNQGGFAFETQRLNDIETRAVAVVDVDGDGRLDIAFTHQAASVSFWRNTPATAPGERPTFTLGGLRGVTYPAHAMAWGDLNDDGRVDLVTGSYDAELLLRLGNAFMFSSGAGVVAYTRTADGFTGTRLADSSQALAISLTDLTSDGRPDIHVGNDFALVDQFWSQTDGGWQPASPFPVMTHSTMGLDAGDVDNDGQTELFASDMNPYDTGVETMTRWLPMMHELDKPRPMGDPQFNENMLFKRGPDGTYSNVSAERRVNASGWSWSGEFGDLDNDGFLDLYVVNGMIDADLFDYLPNHELVEQNQAFRNQGDGSFMPAPEWKLSATESGRGMMIADFDNDGRLDIVVNNLRAPAILYANQTCGGQAVEVSLKWLAAQNTQAIGAQLALHTTAGTFYRDVRVSCGYLSGSPARVHFGVPAGAVVQRLEVRWPDGAVTATTEAVAGGWLTLTRQEP